MTDRNIKFVGSLVVFAAIFLIGQIVYAGTYYVSPSGSAAWPSCTTTANPCSAVAAESSAVAGDTVLFMDGTYNVGSSSWSTPAFNPAHSGTAGNPITFKALNKGAAIIVGATGGAYPLMGSYGGSYITYDGFNLRFPQNERAFVFFNSDHCVVQNCEATGDAYGDCTVNHEAIRVENSTNLLIFNNVLHGVHSNPEGCYDSSAIKSFTASNMVVKNNLVYDCTGGIYDKAQGQNNSYYYNVIHDMHEGMAFHVMTQLMSGQAAGNGATNNIYVYQNIIYNLLSGTEALFIDQNGSYTLDNIQFYNNTIDASSSSGTFVVYAAHSNTNTQVYNNIAFNAAYFTAFFDSTTKPGFEDYNDIYSTTLFEAYRYNTGGTKTDYSSISSWCSAYGYDCHSINTNPSFVNPGARDYHLQSGSPALSSGRSGSYPAVMGAYITGNETIGPTTTGKVPSAPQNLKAQ